MGDIDWENQNAGYFNDSIAKEPTQITSTLTTANEEKNKAVTAVSISQICKLTIPNEGLVIHKKKIYHINLVAFVYEVLDVNPTKIHLLVDDYTAGGPLEINHIIGDAGTQADNADVSMFDDNGDSIQNGHSPRTIDSIKVGDYIRCFGLVKYNQDRSNVVAYNIKFIENPNEITMHILEVIRDSMFLERSAADRMGLPQGTAAVQNQTTTNKFKNNGDGQYADLSTREIVVMKFFQQDPNRARVGISVDEISANIKSLTKDQIVDSLRMLTNEGQIWETSENVWAFQ